MKIRNSGTSCTAAIGSVTQAMKAQSALGAAAISSTVVKLESASSRRGCIYGVRYACIQDHNVHTVLSNARVAVKEWIQE